ncbi:hypothetical protein IJ579_02350 [bacterium]|nr:hypothetical protein [bacterium]
MATDRIDDSVGKKIVEALKMQGQDIVEEAEEQVDEFEPVQEPEFVEQPAYDSAEDETVEEEIPEPIFSSIDPQPLPQVQLQPQAQSYVDTAFQQSLERNLGTMNTVSGIEFPANIEILKKLIAKLPAGVSKQTGALIIQQTMEALGISMKSVIAEARQVQNEISSNIRECQASIVDYRKQISILENQAQQHQKQFAMLSDIISLFVHTAK